MAADENQSEYFSVSYNSAGFFIADQAVAEDQSPLSHGIILHRYGG
jgi:hypothetical protein